MRSGLRSAVAAGGVTCLACLAGLAPAQATVTLSNATTIVDVEGGDAANGLIPYDGYFRYTDIATGEETTWSIDPVLIGPGGVSVLSDGILGSASASGGGALSSGAAGAIGVSAFTELVGTNAKTTFTLTSTAAMDGTTFVFYAENDIFGFADDTAAFTGSIGGGDLQLFMFDTLAVSGGSPGLTNVLSGEVVAGATLSLFGSGSWTAFGDALELGDLSVLSSDGSNFETGPGDLGLALGFDLVGTSAIIVVNYDTVATLPPELVPESTALALFGLGLLGLAATGRRRIGRN